MEMTQNGSQCKILVFTCLYIPKTVFSCHVISIHIQRYFSFDSKEASHTLFFPNDFVEKAAFEVTFNLVKEIFYMGKFQNVEIFAKH